MARKGKFCEKTLRILGLHSSGVFERRQREEEARRIASQRAEAIAVFGTPDEARARSFTSKTRPDQEAMEFQLDGSLDSMEERAVGGNFANA